MTSPPTPHPFLLFHDPPTTELHTLSLHDALPISSSAAARAHASASPASSIGVATFSCAVIVGSRWKACRTIDRKSTRLNSSHGSISYAVFCLKKKNNAKKQIHIEKPGMTSSP